MIQLKYRKLSSYISKINPCIKCTEGEDFLNIGCKSVKEYKSPLTEEQLSNLRETLSEPMTRDNSYYLTKQTQDAIQFVNEKFNLFYSESKIIL